MLSTAAVYTSVHFGKVECVGGTVQYSAALVTPVLSDLHTVLSHVVWRCGMYVGLCSCRQLTLQIQTDCPGSCARQSDSVGAGFAV